MSITTRKIKLVATEREGVVLNLTQSGAFLILISDVLSVGAAIIFSICKTDGKPAVITKHSASSGITLEQPTIVWTADGNPIIKYMNFPKDEADHEFFVTIFTHNSVIA